MSCFSYRRKSKFKNSETVVYIRKKSYRTSLTFFDHPYHIVSLTNNYNFHFPFSSGPGGAHLFGVPDGPGDRDDAVQAVPQEVPTAGRNRPQAKRRGGTPLLPREEPGGAAEAVIDQKSTNIFFC